MRITKISWSQSEVRSYDFQSVTVGGGLEAEVEEGEDRDAAWDKLRDLVQARVEAEADVAQVALIEWRDATKKEGG